MNLTSAHENLDDAPATDPGPVDAAATAPPLLDIAGLVVEYRLSHRADFVAVDGVDLRVAGGEFVSLVGESGSGKTTLIRGALGLLAPSARISAGTIAYSGTDVTGWPARRMARVRGNYVGFIPQDPGTSLNPVKRIGQQVIEAIRFNSRDAHTRGDLRVDAVARLAEAGLADPERVSHQYPHELSGGMKQRVLIAIALAGNPRLVIADEPTSSLDVTVQKVILDHLAALAQARDIGVLFVTHDLGIATDRSDRIAVMSRGRVVEQGPASALVREPRSGYTRMLLEAAPGRHDARLAPDPARTAVAASAPAGGVTSPALVARDVRKRYHVRVGATRTQIDALAGVDLVLRTGTTHAIVGESGAGKSTLAGVLAGLSRPDSGEVVVAGQDLLDLDRRGLRALRRRLQYVFQNPYTSLDPRFTVHRILAEPLRAFRVFDSRSALTGRINELLDEVALDRSFAARTPDQLSGGQRQRVAIARALALKPEIVVLDEAVSALDVSVQAQILQLLVDLQAELGLSYVFVTHDLGVVRMIADDVTVMRDGRVVETGTADQVLGAPADAYTRQLLEAIPGRAS